MSECHRALIAYGLHLFSRATGINRVVPDGDPPDQGSLSFYEDALGPENQDCSQPLPSIFSFVRLDPDPPPQLSYVFPHPFEISEPIFKAHTLDAAASQRSAQDWNGFFTEFDRVKNSLAGQDDNRLFEAFYHLFRRWAWCLPAFRGGDGVSLFEQWKTIAAMAFASGDQWRVPDPQRTFTLVGGDIPGIQDFVYTITSRGAARGLRGRSFFIQLLGDAVIKTLLDTFDLTAANVIYAAGGNFMVLAPHQDDTPQKLDELSARVEKALLASFEGDLAACLAWEPLKLSQVGTDEFSDPVSRRLKEKITAQKQRRFSQAPWEALFAPQGKPGNHHCVICQRMLGVNEGSLMPAQSRSLLQEPGYRCPACGGFEDLAGSLAGAVTLAVGSSPPSAPQHWQQALHDVCGCWYAFGKGKAPLTADAAVYLVNEPDFAGKAHGFRLIANTTPHVSQADLNAHFPGNKNEDPPRVGGIRSFSMLARNSQGIKRVGVLRMDVDNLGSIITRGLNCRSLPAVSALSSALDRFFNGWLDEICRRKNNSSFPQGGERLYVIYAGGDDLFVVGSWNLVPELAYWVHWYLAEYTGKNPSLGISGGVALEDEKFPLYQAAEHAGEAEGKAKDHQFNGRSKDALCFLGEAVRWSEWEKVLDAVDLVDAALGCTALDYSARRDSAPDALLQVLQDIYMQYLDQQRKRPAGSGETEFGPWMWRAAYALTRMNERIKNSAAQQAVKDLQNMAVAYPSVRYAALAARWVELIKR